MVGSRLWQGCYLVILLVVPTPDGVLGTGMLHRCSIQLLKVPKGPLNKKYKGKGHKMLRIISISFTHGEVSSCSIL
ncbi:hypothetical protein V8C37DRAFT_385273, partial [Trichoderma ceciliae]